MGTREEAHLTMCETAEPFPRGSAPSCSCCSIWFLVFTFPRYAGISLWFKHISLITSDVERLFIGLFKAIHGVRAARILCPFLIAGFFPVF